MLLLKLSTNWRGISSFTIFATSIALLIVDADSSQRSCISSLNQKFGSSVSSVLIKVDLREDCQEGVCQLAPLRVAAVIRCEGSLYPILLNRQLISHGAKLMAAVTSFQ